MIKVLHVISSIGTPGGVQSLIWNYYKNIDETEIKFDFVVSDNTYNGFEKNFISKGSRIYYIPPKKQNIIKHIISLNKVLNNKKYDIVHCHQDYLGFLTMFIAWKNGIKVRIIHSHKANLREKFFKKIERKILTRVTILFSTHLFACGIEAAKWTYGEKKYLERKVYILKNAIDLQKYSYNSKYRNELRSKLNLKGKKVIGNIARFTFQKNHEALIEIFNYIYKIDKSYRLLLIGDGEKINEIKEMVSKYNLDNAILFLGNRTDIPELLSLMDCFVLTSRFEGLPVTLVEAQCSGLYCVVSDSITREININNRINYISLNDNYKLWYKAIDQVINKVRYNDEKVIKKFGYDISTETIRLVNFYKSSLEV